LVLPAELSSATVGQALAGAARCCSRRRLAHVAKKDFATALTQLVIAGQKPPSADLMSNDPAIHGADKSAWTTGSSPVVTKNDRLAP
jgi:hypothetical protein